MRQTRLYWLCPQCGRRNELERPRCRGCRKKEALTYRIAYARLLLPGPYE